MGIHSWRCQKERESRFDTYWVIEAGSKLSGAWHGKALDATGRRGEGGKSLVLEMAGSDSNRKNSEELL